MKKRRKINVKFSMVVALVMTVMILSACQGNIDSAASRENDDASSSIIESEILSTQVETPGSHSTVVEESSMTNTIRDTTVTSLKISEQNEIVATHFDTLLNDSSAQVIYSSTPVLSSESASEIYSKSEEHSLSLSDNSFGQLIYEDLFLAYDWQEEAEAQVNNDGFFIGTPDHFFYIALESDLVLLYDDGVCEYYRVKDQSSSTGDEDYYPHTALLQLYYSEKSSSVYDLRLDSSSTDANGIGQDLIEAYLNHFMEQEPVNRYKISDYKIVDLSVSSDDETAPTEIIISLKAIVVPDQEENTTYWFKGSGVELWAEDDKYKNQPCLTRQLLWKKDGQHWVCTEMAVAGIDFD